MKFLSALVLYTCLAFGANAALADMAALKGLRAGDMKKLVVHAAAQEVPQTPFETAGGGTGRLSDYEGRVTLVNFWATWCPPCRKEMPTLSALQAELGGDDFQIVTIATGRNLIPAMKGFFDEIGVDNLPLHRDPKQQLARQMGVFGLPTTMVLDRSGREIARLTGDADWNSDSARAIFRALVKDGAAG